MNRESINLIWPLRNSGTKFHTKKYRNTRLKSILNEVLSMFQAVPTMEYFTKSTLIHNLFSIQNINYSEIIYFKT